jgi:ferredoxin
MMGPIAQKRTATLKCPVCRRFALHTYYDDYRPGKPNAYWQCHRCGACHYFCPVHRRWNGSRPSDAADGGCVCRHLPDEEDDVVE